MANYTYVTYPGFRHYYQYMSCGYYYANGLLYYNNTVYRLPGAYLAYPSNGLIVGLASGDVWFGSRFYRTSTPAWAFRIGNSLYIIVVTESGKLIVLRT